MTGITSRTKPILTVEDLRVHFRTRDGLVQAVQGISFDLFPGEALGIVGESGCGKSVSALALLRLIQCPPGRITARRVEFDGAAAQYLALGTVRGYVVVRLESMRTGQRVERRLMVVR